MGHLEEKTISSEQKFDGKIVKLFVDKAELEVVKLMKGPDGEPVEQEFVRDE